MSSIVPALKVGAVVGVCVSDSSVTSLQMRNGQANKTKQTANTVVSHPMPLRSKVRLPIRGTKQNVGGPAIDIATVRTNRPVIPPSIRRGTILAISPPQAKTQKRRGVQAGKRSGPSQPKDPLSMYHGQAGMCIPEYTGSSLKQKKTQRNTKDGAATKVKRQVEVPAMTASLESQTVSTTKEVVDPYLADIGKILESPSTHVCLSEKTTVLEPLVCKVAERPGTSASSIQRVDGRILVAVTPRSQSQTSAQHLTTKVAEPPRTSRSVQTEAVDRSVVTATTGRKTQLVVGHARTDDLIIKVVERSRTSRSVQTEKIPYATSKHDSTEQTNTEKTKTGSGVCLEGAITSEEEKSKKNGSN